MDSKQILLLPFLALLFVVVDSQDASRRLLEEANLIVSANIPVFNNLSLLTLSMFKEALQKNLCVNVTRAIQYGCYYNATESITFSIDFTRRANTKCKRLARRLDKQKNGTVTATRCAGDSNSIQANMYADLLQWVSATSL